MMARIKRISINVEAFLLIMQARSAWKVSHGVPDSARLRGAILDPYTQNLSIMIEDDSFEEVYVGDVVPLLETEFVRIR